MRPAAPDAPVVLKIGGGLLGIPGALDAAAAAITELARHCRVIVVPGGGPFADTVRRMDQDAGLSDDAAHWMAILAMDQYGHLLVERIDRAVLVEEPGGLAGVLAAGRAAVLAPYRWMRAADVLPHTWDATSDSVAAFVAGAVDARLLVLVKPADGDPAALVDRTFENVMPAGLAWRVIGWERLQELTAMCRPGAPLESR